MFGAAFASSDSGIEFGDHQALHHRGRDALHRGAREHAVGDVGVDRVRAVVLQELGGFAQRAGGVADVVHDDAGAALDLADDGHLVDLAGAGAALVHDGEAEVQALGQFPRPAHAAHVGRDDQQVRQIPEVVLDVHGEDRGRVEVVHRDVEEALDLAGVQVERQNAVDAGLRHQVRHQLRRDRGAGRRAAVLAGVAEIGDHGGDARGRGAAQRVGDDEQLHQVVVGGVAGGLHDEDVLAADVVVDLDEDFLVVEPFDPGVGQLHRHAAIDRHAPGDRLGQLPVRVARDELEVDVRLHARPLRFRPAAAARLSTGGGGCKGGCGAGPLLPSARGRPCWRSLPAG